jgi:hypothetical protein
LRAQLAAKELADEIGPRPIIGAGRLIERRRKPRRHAECYPVAFLWFHNDASLHRMSDAVPVKTPDLSCGDDDAVLERFRERDAVGDRLAVVECTVYCDERDLPLPRWALAVRAARDRRYLSGEPMGVLVGQRGGRHGDPRVERAEQVRRELSVNSFRAGRCAGLEGQNWILASAEVYDHQSLLLTISGTLDTETMQKHYYEWQQKGFSWVPHTAPDAQLVTCSGTLHQLRATTRWDEGLPWVRK